MSLIKLLTEEYTNIHSLRESLHSFVNRYRSQLHIKAVENNYSESISVKYRFNAKIYSDEKVTRSNKVWITVQLKPKGFMARITKKKNIQRVINNEWLPSFRKELQSLSVEGHIEIEGI